MQGLRVGFCCSLCVLSSVLVSTLVGAAYPGVGLNPDRRPDGAPVIEWVKHDRAWYQQALTGINPPYPKSLYFLDNQGDWYTPFSRPGMPGYYDLRGWYR